MTVMGDALMDGLSDAGSTPARSTKKKRRSYGVHKENKVAAKLSRLRRYFCIGYASPCIVSVPIIT